MMSRKDNLISNISEIAGCSRRGELSDFSSHLNLFLADLQKYLQITTPDASTLKKISYSLETVMILQKQKDFVALADILEYELVKLL